MHLWSSWLRTAHLRAGSGLRRATTASLSRSPTRRMVFALTLISLTAAMLAARTGSSDLWLWNLDLPKINYPFAVFYHEALQHGELPLWNDRLGLGFPLYAEGQIGAFYPPNWLIFRLDPLAALDMARVLHLAFLGVGTGLLALRVSGSRAGAIVAALTAVLSGAIVTKLEWTNLVAAYAWAPWVLLPLARRPVPTRGGLVAAGSLWGLQALAGHPNTWLLTGLSATVWLLGSAPRPMTALRVAVFWVLGVFVGAVQLVPTLVLTTLSVRSDGLSREDIFAGAATPFDGLLFAFANVFVRNDRSGWDLATAWYPDSPFALLEGNAFVGIPVLVLAAIGWRVQRGRRGRALIASLLAVPVLAAFQLEIWTHIPLMNGLRSPTRAYLFVVLGLALLAALGVSRLGRDRSAPRIARLVTIAALGAYLGVGLLAIALPATFRGLLLDFSWSVNLPAERAAAARTMALDAIAQPWPALGEAAIALLFAGIVWARTRDTRPWRSWPVVLVAVLPLLLFSPGANQRRAFGDFTFGGNDLHAALRALEPHRLLTVGAPGWYPGMPDQLAAADVRDISMFSSLNLKATDALVDRLRDDPDAERLRRIVGIDTVVTFGRACPGELRARARSDDAYICTLPGALRPPYWIPRGAVALGTPSTVPWEPTEATIDTANALRSAVAIRVERSTGGEGRYIVDAPSDGWVFIDRAWWPAWMTAVDGRSESAVRALAGQLVPVRSGPHEISQRLVPLEAIGSFVIGIAVIAAGVAWARGHIPGGLTLSRWPWTWVRAPRRARVK